MGSSQQEQYRATYQTMRDTDDARMEEGAAPPGVYRTPKASPEVPPSMSV